MFLVVLCRNTLAQLKLMCDTLDLERGGTKESIVERIIDFMMCPHASDRKQKGGENKPKLSKYLRSWHPSTLGAIQVLLNAFSLKSGRQVANPPLVTLVCSDPYSPDLALHCVTVAPLSSERHVRHGPFVRYVFV